MRPLLKKTVLVVLVLFLLAQVYQPALNKDERKPTGDDFIIFYHLPPDIGDILKASCYDCHSNTTRYAWYDYIQPARSLVESHVKDAKKELNLNEWGTYSARKKERLLKSMKSQVEDGEMPLSSYTLLHPTARLDDAKAKALISWIEKQQE